jgi:hypothetical protein
VRVLGRLEPPAVHQQSRKHVSVWQKQDPIDTPAGTI